jgi:hypothetical protein
MKVWTLKLRYTLETMVKRAEVTTKQPPAPKNALSNGFLLPKVKSILDIGSIKDTVQKKLISEINKP